MASLSDEISSRRTFAIISHPDAGKTTLTEKLLLYTGSIQTAGSVKGKSSVSSKLSSCFQNAKLAAGEFENVYVVDSQNICTDRKSVV